MATIKSYTTIEQSRKLAEILPIESADMWYSYYGNTKYNPTIAYKGQQWFLCQIRNSLHDDIPCWSLAALLSVLPKSVRLVGTPKDSYWYCECVNGNDQWCADFGSADNPIDACVAMINRLHEQMIYDFNNR